MPSHAAQPNWTAPTNTRIGPSASARGACIATTPRARRWNARSKSTPTARWRMAASERRSRSSGAATRRLPASRSPSAPTRAIPASSSASPGSRSRITPPDGSTRPPTGPGAPFTACRAGISAMSCWPRARRSHGRKRPRLTRCAPRAPCSPTSRSPILTACPTAIRTGWRGCAPACSAPDSPPPTRVPRSALTGQRIGAEAVGTRRAAMDEEGKDQDQPADERDQHQQIPPARPVHVMEPPHRNGNVGQQDRQREKPAQNLADEVQHDAHHENEEREPPEFGTRRAPLEIDVVLRENRLDRSREIHVLILLVAFTCPSARCAARCPRAGARHCRGAATRSEPQGKATAPPPHRDQATAPRTAPAPPRRAPPATKYGPPPPWPAMSGTPQFRRARPAPAKGPERSQRPCRRESQARPDSSALQMPRAPRSARHPRPPSPAPAAPLPPPCPRRAAA